MPMTVAKVEKTHLVAHDLTASGIPHHPRTLMHSQRTAEGGFSVDDDWNDENCMVVRWTPGTDVPDGEAVRQEIDRRLMECASVLMHEGYWTSLYPSGAGLRVVKLEWLK